MILDGDYEQFVPESDYIHFNRIFITVFGLVTSLCLFVFIASITVFMMSVNILSVNGNLGNATSFNRQNQQLVR